MTLVNPQPNDTKELLSAGSTEVKPDGAGQPAPDVGAQNRSGTVKGFALGVAGTLLAGGAFMATRGESDDNPVRTKAPIVSEPEQPVEAQPDNTSDTIVVVSPPSTQETLPVTPVIEPKLITAMTPEGILEEFSHDVEAAFNNSDSAMRRKSLTYFLGDKGEDLSAEYTERIGDVLKYRATHPEFEVDQSFANTKAQFYPDELNPSSVVIVTEMTDASGTTKVRYTFQRATATVQQYDVLDKDTPVWLLYRETFLNPGDVEFE